jgi:phosphoesterase RecJ-like protein
MTTPLLQQFQVLLEAPKKCVVIPHKNPDGDALGSCLAWTEFLNAKGHEAVVISPNEYPAFLNWLPGEKSILKFSSDSEKALQLIANADVVFTLDFNDLHRIDGLEAPVAAANALKVMIDHHENPKDYAAITYSVPSVGSTCELVYNLISQLDAPALTPSMAECLYTGIMTDTGSFRYPATTAATHKAVAHFLELGISHEKIHQQIYDTYSFNRLRLLGIALENLKQHPKLPAVYITLSQEELDACDFQKGDTEGFVNYGLRIEGNQVAVLMTENKEENRIRMSFRSFGKFPVHDFAAQHFNGGGHHNAAGGISFDSLEETVHQLCTHLEAWKAQFEA